MFGNILSAISVTCSRKRTVGKFSSMLSFKHNIDSSVCAEYDGASVKKKYQSEAEL